LTISKVNTKIHKDEIQIENKEKQKGKKQGKKTNIKIIIIHFGINFTNSQKKFEII